MVAPLVPLATAAARVALPVAGRMIAQAGARAAGTAAKKGLQAMARSAEGMAARATNGFVKQGAQAVAKGASSRATQVIGQRVARQFVQGAAKNLARTPRMGRAGRLSLVAQDASEQENQKPAPLKQSEIQRAMQALQQGMLPGQVQQNLMLVTNASNVANMGLQQLRRAGVSFPAGRAGIPGMPLPAAPVPTMPSVTPRGMKPPKPSM